MLLLAASLLLCLGTGTGSGSGSSAASSSASATNDLALALAAVRTLTSRVEQLERRVHTLESESSSPPCGVAGAGFPTLPEGAEYAYSGCTRNVERLAVNSTTMCQSGTVKIYDTQTTNTTGPRCHTAHALPHCARRASALSRPDSTRGWPPGTGLFSLWINSHHIVHDLDVYHFVCTLTRESPLVAHCALTFEEPARPQGPAWVQVQLTKALPPSCEPQALTVVGAYLFGQVTEDAGIYSYYGERQ